MKMIIPERCEIGHISVVVGENAPIPLEEGIFFDFLDAPHYEEGKAVRDAYAHFMEMTDKYADQMAYAEVGRDFSNNLCGRVVLRELINEEL